MIKFETTGVQNPYIYIYIYIYKQHNESSSCRCLAVETIIHYHETWKLRPKSNSTNMYKQDE